MTRRQAAQMPQPRLKWARAKDRFGDTVYTANGYRIERFAGLAGAQWIWVLTGPAGEHKKTTLSAAKWVAERHARNDPAHCVL